MNQIKTGEFIAAQRKEKNYTQAELAQRLGITDKSVSKWECGRCMPDTSVIQPLCKALDVSVSELFAGERLEDGELEKKAAEGTLLEIVRMYENIKSYKHVLFGLFLIAAGYLLRIEIVNGDASPFLQFLDGTFLGLSVGVKILGIVWTIYGFAKTSQKAGYRE